MTVKELMLQLHQQKIRSFIRLFPFWNGKNVPVSFDHLCFPLRIRLRPRILRDVSVSDTRTTVQGTEISFPVGIAPTAFHCLAWHEGEMATARGEEWVGALI